VDSRRVKRRCVEEEGVYKVNSPMKSGIDKSSAFLEMTPSDDMSEKILETTFGSFVGVEEYGVRKFLGIKYAQVKNWLSAPELITSYGNDIVDATRYG